MPLKKIFGFCLSLLVVFPSMVFANIKEKDELIKITNISQNDLILPIIGALKETIDIRFLTRPEREFIFNERLPFLQKSNEKLIENNNILRNKANELPHFSEAIHSRLEFTDTFARDVSNLIDLLNEMNNFKNYFRETLIETQKILSKILIDMGYPETEVRENFLHIPIQDIEKKRLVDVLKRSIEQNPHRWQFESFVDNLRRLEASENIRPLKEKYITETKVIIDIFRFVVNDIQNNHSFSSLPFLYENIEQENSMRDAGLLQPMDNFDYEKSFERLENFRENSQRSMEKFMTEMKNTEEDFILPPPKEKEEFVPQKPIQEEGKREFIPQKVIQEKEEISPKNHENEESPSSFQSQTNIWDVLKVVIPVLSIMIGFFITRKRKGKFSKYLKEVDKVYTEYKLKSKRLEAELYRLKDMISEDLENGKIDEAAYSIVEKRIEKYMSEAREQEINEQFGGLPQHLKNNMRQMLQDGKISEKEFEKMMGVIDTTTLNDSDKNDLKEIFKTWKNKDR